MSPMEIFLDDDKLNLQLENLNFELNIIRVKKVETKINFMKIDLDSL